MDSELIDLLKRAGNGSGSYKVLSLQHLATQWIIEEKKYQDFWSTYCRLASAQKKMMLAEKTDENPPVVMHFTFSFSKETG